MMQAALPRQGSDHVGGDLFVAAYHRKLGHMPAGQIAHLTDKALERCKWFPTITECLAIADEWQRNDDAVRNRDAAITMVGREKQARMNEAMDAMRDGVMTQAEIDALPERWRSIGETRGYLRRIGEGEYVLRVMPASFEQPA